MGHLLEDTVAVSSFSQTIGFVINMDSYFILYDTVYNNGNSTTEFLLYCERCEGKKGITSQIYQPTNLGESPVPSAHVLTDATHHRQGILYVTIP